MSPLFFALCLTAGAAVPVDAAGELTSARALTAPALELRAQDGDWVSVLTAQAALVEQRSPELALAMTDMVPSRTRAGSMRFTDPALRNPDAAPLLLVRLATGADDAGLRVALVDAARRTGGDWAPAIAAMAPMETDVAVRRMMVEVLDRAPIALATVALQSAVVDLEPDVRGAAARAIGGNADGAVLGSLLLPLIDDGDPKVRAEACRSAGWLSVTDAWDALVVRVSDKDADVRLRAMRALERLDAGRAAALPAIRAAVNDADPTAARAARKITGG